jgi:hypothetical protein
VDCARILGERKEKRKKSSIKILRKLLVTDSGILNGRQLVFTNNNHDNHNHHDLHHHHIQALQYSHFVFGECDCIKNAY